MKSPAGRLAGRAISGFIGFAGFTGLISLIFTGLSSGFFAKHFHLGINRKDELIAATRQELQAEKMRSEAERSAKNALIRRLDASGLSAAEIGAISAMDENEVRKALGA